jgi:hypothetical protein
MSIKIAYKQLINLSANDDLLKRISREIKIINIEEQTLVMEISSCLLNKNNSVLVHFIVESENQKFEIQVTCKVTDFESQNNIGRVTLRLIQYNKKEWGVFRNLFLEKQNSSVKLLKNIRGR